MYLPRSTGMTLLPAGPGLAVLMCASSTCHLMRARRAVITGKDTRFKSISDLRGQTIGVSRMGSGSQIFASYMALKEGWFSAPSKQEVEKLDFKGRWSLQAALSPAPSEAYRVASFSAGHFQGQLMTSRVYYQRAHAELGSIGPARWRE